MDCVCKQRGKGSQDQHQHLISFWVSGPVIVGAGPSGLATAACLKQQSVPSIILEKEDCMASMWQYKTYGRLKLHLPKYFCELPLMEFPQTFPTYPTKEQFISYINAYAERFNIRPRFNRRVQSACYDSGLKRWRVRTEMVRERESILVEYICRWLVVATGENAEPMVPDLPGLSSFKGRVVHTSDYKTGSEMEGQKVLVIGSGNSGMEVCLDLCNHDAKPFMVVRNSVHVLPREMFGLSTFGVAMGLLKWLPLRMVDKFLLMASHVILGSTEKQGLKRPEMGPIELKNTTGKTPVLDVGALAKIKSGKIKIVPAVKSLTLNGAKFVNGQEEAFDSVILATGYKSNVPSWLKERELFGEEGLPRKSFPNGWKGEKGLYSVGFTRRGLLGVGSDARNVAQDIGAQWRNLGERPHHHKHFILYTKPG
ncbi:hypothetical protein AMTRI_Chr03g148190 [Amborella trichopoda]|uniref:Flavin-containing monooxygenase n=1 Tax=Amborella trichopoda TaxID=13333 RepID=W1P0M1_AMBTC|nr:probable indole-3-pyruvate monooxygenase YUCCA4 [Amborella trichopoda]ERN01488.1 hypothetical protein AMTR_s00002p00269920 [Amborella trichopoda]|eukprot:XP_020519841.1 probable indole-3-pyruvate monooxygenase YUCCA4 [Amborella trichopoda]